MPAPGLVSGPLSLVCAIVLTYSRPLLTFPQPMSTLRHRYVTSASQYHREYTLLTRFKVVGTDLSPIQPAL